MIRDIAKFLITAVGAYFVGIIFLLLSSLLDSIRGWAFSLPTGWMVVVCIVIGFILIDIYKKLFKSKDE